MHRSQKRAGSKNGVPGKTRTCDPWFRKPMLYPAELRGLFGFDLLAHLPGRLILFLTDLRFRKPLLYPAELRDRIRRADIAQAAARHAVVPPHSGRSLEADG